MKFILVLPLLLVLAAPVFADQKLQTLHEQSYEYQISKKDTLWGIALKIRPKKGKKVSPNQVMFAILRKNPDVFEGGNIHFLKPGSALVIPSLPEVLAEPKGKANTFAAEHEQLRKQGRKEAPPLYAAEAIEGAEKEVQTEAETTSDDKDKSADEKESDAVAKEAASTEAEKDKTVEAVDNQQSDKEEQAEEKAESKDSEVKTAEADAAEEKAAASEQATKESTKDKDGLDSTADKAAASEEKAEASADTVGSFSDFTALQNEINNAVKSAAEDVDYSKAVKIAKTPEKAEADTEEKTSGSDGEAEAQPDGAAEDKTADALDPSFDINSAISDIVKSASEAEAKGEKKEQSDAFVKAQGDAAAQTEESQGLAADSTANDKAEADTGGFVEINKDDQIPTSSGEADTSGFIEITKDDSAKPAGSDEADTGGFVEINKGDEDQAPAVNETDPNAQSAMQQKVDVIVEDSLLEEQEEPSYLAWIISALIITALLAYLYYRQVRKKKSYRDSDKVTQRRVVSTPIPEQEKIEGDDVIPTITPVGAVVERHGVTDLSREQPVFKEDIDVKLKLALAYLEIDKCKEAQELLNEVSLEGDLAQQRDAQVILARLADAGAE